MGLYFVIFGAMGYLISYLIKFQTNILEKVFLGFLGYFSLFQFIALPCIALKQSLTMLTTLWLIVLGVLTICVLVLLYKERIAKKEIVSRQKKIALPKKTEWLYICAGLIFLVFVCYFTAIQNYWGWDTAFYIGTVSTTLDTDTMYLYNGETGAMEYVVSFRYALSTFYMNSAVFCKITGISAVMFQKYVMGILCVVMQGLILYLTGKRIFENKLEKAVLFAVTAGVLNFFFVSEFSTAQFLLFRSYEAKGYCANVVIPAVFLALLTLHQNVNKKENWKVLFLVMMASVPVSMSAILIVPMMVFAALAAEFIVTKNRKVITCGIVCMIPNGIYLIIYLLSTLQILEIRV